MLVSVMLVILLFISQYTYAFFDTSSILGMIVTSGKNTPKGRNLQTESIFFQGKLGSLSVRSRSLSVSSPQLCSKHLSVVHWSTHTVYLVILLHAEVI